MGAPKRCPHTNLKPEALGCHLASKGCAAGEHAELQPHSVKSGRAPPLLDLDLPFGPRGQGRGGLIPLRALSISSAQFPVCYPNWRLWFSLQDAGRGLFRAQAAGGGQGLPIQLWESLSVLKSACVKSVLAKSVIWF